MTLSSNISERDLDLRKIFMVKPIEDGETFCLPTFESFTGLLRHGETLGIRLTSRDDVFWQPFGFDNTFIPFPYLFPRVAHYYDYFNINGKAFPFKEDFQTRLFLENIDENKLSIKSIASEYGHFHSFVRNKIEYFCKHLMSDIQIISKFEQDFLVRLVDEYNKLRADILQAMNDVILQPKEWNAYILDFVL